MRVGDVYKENVRVLHAADFVIWDLADVGLVEPSGTELHGTLSCCRNMQSSNIMSDRI